MFLGDSLGGPIQTKYREWQGIGLGQYCADRGACAAFALVKPSMFLPELGKVNWVM